MESVKKECDRESAKRVSLRYEKERAKKSVTEI